jgi:uncharacterized protein involved in type VI secretion and phage assembly
MMMQTQSTTQGVAAAIVRERNGRGQIKVEYPWLDSTVRSNWISVASNMAGNGQGICTMPEIGDEALVAFHHGHFDQPVVIGFMWNGVDQTASSSRTDTATASRYPTARSQFTRLAFLNSTPPRSPSMAGLCSPRRRRSETMP